MHVPGWEEESKDIFSLVDYLVEEAREEKEKGKGGGNGGVDCFPRFFLVVRSRKMQDSVHICDLFSCS